MSIINKLVKDISELAPYTKHCDEPKVTYTKVDNLVIPGNDECQNEDETKFEGSSKFNAVAMYFASHFFNNVCVITGKPYPTTPKIHIKDSICKGNSCVQLPKNFRDIPLDQTGVSLRWIERDKQISVPQPEEEFWKNFNRCERSQTIAFPCGFNCKNFGHANWVIITMGGNNKPPTVERFESFSNDDDEEDDRCIWSPLVDEKLEELFRENFEKYVPKLSNFTYVRPFMKDGSIQTLQEQEKRWKQRDGKNPIGFCSVWSLWYIHFRTSNPGLEANEELMEDVNKKILQIEKERENKGYGKGSLTDFIRRYSLLLVKTEKDIRHLYDHNDDGTFQGLKSSMNDGHSGLFKGFKTKTGGVIQLKNKSPKKSKSLSSLFKNLNLSSSRKSPTKKSPLSSFSPLISPINPHLMALHRHLQKSKNNKKASK